MALSEQQKTALSILFVGVVVAGAMWVGEISQNRNVRRPAWEDLKVGLDLVDPQGAPRNERRTLRSFGKTYESQKWGFAFDYPDIYGDFAEFEHRHTIPGFIEGFDHPDVRVGDIEFPRLFVEIHSLDTYRLRMQDPLQGWAKFVSFDTRLRGQCSAEGDYFPVNHIVQGYGWFACGVGFGDAGCISYTYSIPRYDENVVIKIGASGCQPADGFSGRIDMDSLIKTFRLLE